MRRAVIIGCGGIGFRHLQSLIEASLRLDSIALVEPDPERRVRAATEVRSRAPWIAARSFESTSRLEPELAEDAVIISAVTADLHHRVLRELPAAQPGLLLLEKPVAQSAGELDELRRLVSSRWPAVDGFVNCPRPLFPGYRRFAERAALHARSEEFRLLVHGEAWGLGCNAVHFIDLFRHLTRAEKLEVEDVQVVPDPRGNRRGRNFEEFFGAMRLVNERGQVLQLVCDAPYGGPPGVRVVLDDDEDGVAEVVIDETAGHLSRPHSGVEPFPLLATSQSTGRFLEAFAKGLPPLLPRLDEAALSHRALFESLSVATGRREFAIT